MQFSIEKDHSPGQWVLLSYRLPREPSTPRITVWRKLERLGVARLGDGLVGLPADSRTREHLDWLADEIGEAGGTATVWLATPASTSAQAEGTSGARMPAGSISCCYRPKLQTLKAVTRMG